MRMLFLMPLPVALVTSLACGTTTVLNAASSSSSASSSGGTGGATATASSASSSTGGTGGTGGATPGPTITFGGTVVHVPGGSTTLSSVEVCVYQHPEIPCVMSDTGGHFTTDVPAGMEVAVTLSKPGFTGVVVALVTSDQDQTQWEIGLASTTTDQAFYGAAPGATYPDASHGFLGVFLDSSSNQNQGFAGATVSLTPASGVGPIYAGATFTMADPTLQATSTSGAARFAGLTPGTVEIQIAPGTLSCDPNFGGWSAPDANAVRAPIVAGFETHVGFGCL
jgi:hypothetical protein